MSTFTKVLINSDKANIKQYDFAINIFVSFCKYLDPCELLKLECVCMKFCNYLRSEHSAIASLWKHSRNTYTPFNEYEVLSGMSERDYTKLLCLKNGCQQCGEGRFNYHHQEQLRQQQHHHNVSVYFIPRVRLCKPCLAQNVLSEKNFIENLNACKDVLNAIPTVSHKDPWGKGEKHYWIIDYYRMEEKLVGLSDEEKSQLLEEKEEESRLLIKDDEKRHKMMMANSNEILNSVNEIEETEQLMLELATRFSLGETSESDDDFRAASSLRFLNTHFLSNPFCNYSNLDSDLTSRSVIPASPPPPLPSLDDNIDLIDPLLPMPPSFFGGSRAPLITLDLLYRELSPRKRRQKFILVCLKDRTKTYQRSPPNPIEIWNPIYEFLDLLPTFTNPPFFITNDKDWVNKHVIPKLLQETTNVRRKAKLVGGPGHITTLRGALNHGLKDSPVFFCVLCRLHHLNNYEAIQNHLADKHNIIHNINNEHDYNLDDNIPYNVGVDSDVVVDYFDEAFL
nr:5143_t:CDS:2 [Entrophospora candida]